MMIDLPPSPPAYVEKVQLHSEPQLIETTEFGKIEFRRYLFDSRGLPSVEGAGSVSVFRTQKGWNNPGLVKNTIYYFHSGNANDKVLLDFGAAAILNTLDQEQSLDDVQIVCPLSGNSFLSAPFEGWLWNTVSAWAEKDTKTSEKTRFSAGASMGGFVSLSVFFTRPEFFAGVSANAPALVAWDFSDAEAVESYATRNQLPIQIAQFVASFIGSAFATQAEFSARDPIALASFIDASRVSGKAIYLDVGSSDDLGLYEGARVLKDKIQSLQTSRFYFEEVVDGRHDVPYFNSRLAQTFKFLLGR